MIKPFRPFMDRFVNLSDSSNRATIHALLLLVIGAAMLAGAAAWQDPGAAISGSDKLLHYRLGQLFAAGVFYSAYMCIVARVLVCGRQNRSITAVLLWLPLMIFCLLLLSVAVVLLFALIKEAIDWASGTFSWPDLAVSLDGALTVAPTVGLIMALTPLFIPLDLLLQIPRLILCDVRTGMWSIDDYLKESGAHSARRQAVDVLVIEDDIYCAALVMKVCRKVGLRCYHTACASEGLDFLYAHIHKVRLVILDNFLRVDADGRNMTGAEWLQRIDRDFPIGRRHFAVVMVSGHTDLIGKTGELADLVLQKPWSTGELIRFMQNKNIVQPSAFLSEERCAANGTP